MFDYESLQHLSGSAAEIDIACPACGPSCKSTHNRARKVLRIWNKDDGFATYNVSAAAHQVMRTTITATAPIIRPKTILRSLLLRY
jgi:hypothetical protein